MNKKGNNKFISISQCWAGDLCLYTLSYYMAGTEAKQEYNFLKVTLWVLIKEVRSASSLDFDPKMPEKEN